MLNITATVATSSAQPQVMKAPGNIDLKNKTFLEACQGFALPLLTNGAKFIADTAYRGKAGACRCGCCGKYYKPGTTAFFRIWNDFQRLYDTYGADKTVELKVAIDVWKDEYCIDLVYPATPGSRNLKCITLYFRRPAAYISAE